MNDYTTQCDKCGKRTWYETEQQCHMQYTKSQTCDLGHKHTVEPLKYERCTGTLRLIDRTNITTWLVIGKRYTFQDLNGVQKRYTLGRTTGWKPVLLLLHNARSTGSSITVKGPEIEAIGGGVYKVPTYF